MDKEKHYLDGCELMNKKQYDSAINEFMKVANYKDASSLIIECQQKQLTTKRNILIKNTSIILIVIVAVMGSIFGYLSNMYNKAAKAIQNGNYKLAIDTFSVLGDFKNSKSLITDAKYGYINQLASEKKFTDAQAILKEISNNYSNVDVATKGYTLIFNNCEVGDSFKFGIAYKYKKDNMEDFNREDYDLLEWKVVATEEDRVLLTTNTICWDNEPFHNGSNIATWENSTLRTWLNGSLYDTIFTDAEKSMILETEVKNKENPKYHKGGGKDTKDKLFIPSVDEIQKYYSSSKELNPAQDDEDMYDENMYFLRTTGKSHQYVSYIDSNGKINLFGYDVNGYCYGDIDDDCTIGTKPFMWVKCDNNKKSNINTKFNIKYTYTEIYKNNPSFNPIDSYYYCNYSHTGYERTYSHSGSSSSSSSSSWDTDGKYGGNYYKYYRDNYGYKDDYYNYF